MFSMPADDTCYRKNKAENGNGISGRVKCSHKVREKAWL